MLHIGNREIIEELETVEVEAVKSMYTSASNQSIRECGLGLAATGGALVALAANTDVLGLNRVIGLGLKRQVTAADLDQVLDLYDARQVSRFFIQVNPIAEATGLPELLQGLGFRHYNNWVKLHRDGGSSPPVETGFELRRIGPDEAAAFGTLVTSCFDWPRHAIAWVADLVGQPGWRHYMAYDRSKPIATGAFYSNGEGSAWIDFAATLPEYRGRGAQSALLSRRIRDAAELGCRRFVVETAEDTAERDSPSFRRVLAFGFRPAYVRPNYIFTANDSRRRAEGV